MMATEAEKALITALGAENVRDGQHSDEIGGIRPRLVASVDGTESTAAAMRVAAEYDLRVVPRGSGSKLEWCGQPDDVDVVLDVSPATGIVEHAAGDLVVHVKAGTTIADVQYAVGVAGQQLAIDQPLSLATAGGVIATATSGPCRYSYGGVRDLLIGITVVRADGTVTTSGGKVVKNVAGYDLGKIYTGSFGTLGVITEAIFRLHPLPDENRWISLTVADIPSATEGVDLIRHSQAMPAAIEVDDADGSITVCAQLSGRPNATHARAVELAAALGEHAEVLERAPEWWGGYPFDQGGIGLRIGVAPAKLADALAAVRDAASGAGVSPTVRGAAGLGVLHVALPGKTEPGTLAGFVATLRERCEYAVLVNGPKPAVDTVDVWGQIEPGVLNLMRRTKDQFDPEHRLAPGRFVGGI
ncbi:MAG: FAD-binding protein [Pseudonocardiaceae bacterium]|nr:FAD-binding protein [Pseudonocardiaceae bacterium]